MQTGSVLIMCAKLDCICICQQSTGCVVCRAKMCVFVTSGAYINSYVDLFASKKKV